MPSEARSKARFAWLLLVVPLLAMSGTRGLWSPDEPRYAEVAREIWTGGDPVVMHLAGEVYPDKPPLLFWLAGALGAASGWSAPAMRLVSVLAILLCAGLVQRFAERWFGEREAVWAPVVFLTTTMTVWLGSRLQIDPLLTACGTAALWLLVRASDGVHPTGNRLAAGLCLGLGALAKGPVAWSNVGLVALAWLLLDRDPHRTRWRPAVAGGFVTLALLPVAGWAAAAIVREPELAKPLLETEHLARIAEARSHPGPPWEPALEMPVFLLPWTLPALAMAWTALRRWRRQPPSTGTRRGLLWWGALLLFFSIVSEKRALYLLPAYPAVALLVARWLCQRERLGLGRGWRWLTVPSAAVLTIAGLVACFTFTVAGRLADVLPGASGFAWRGVATGVPTAVLAALAWRAALAGRPLRWAGLQAAAFATAATAAAVLFLPLIDARKSPEAVAAELAARPEHPSIVPAVGVHPEGYRFYSGRPVVDGRLDEALASEGSSFLALVERDRFERLSPDIRALVEIAGHWPVSSREVLLLVRRKQGQ